MKRLFVVLVWLALLVLTTGLVVGCAEKPTEVTPTPAPVTPTPAPPGPIPTPTPVPTPQEGQAKFEIVDSDMFLASDRELRIVGIVKNTGDGVGRPHDSHLVDASGKVVAQPFLWFLNYIEPGQKSPFFCCPVRWHDSSGLAGFGASSEADRPRGRQAIYLLSVRGPDCIR